MKRFVKNIILNLILIIKFKKEKRNSYLRKMIYQNNDYIMFLLVRAASL